ncbi:hypothetical protein D3C76_667660 [compost metagenome]
MFKLIQWHGLDGPQPLPVLLVVGQIACASRGLVIKPQHHLVLIKLAGFGVYLVHHIDRLTIQLITNEYINVITISPFGAPDVAVVVGHG